MDDRGDASYLDVSGLEALDRKGEAERQIERPIASRMGVVILIYLFRGQRSRTTISSAILFEARDNSSASRRTPSSSLHDQRLVPFDCESPECRIKACAESESPSRSRDRCRAETEFSSAYLPDVDRRFADILQSIELTNRRDVHRVLQRQIRS